MEAEYNLDEEDKKILNELNNLYGVSQNRDVFANLISYIKLRKANNIDIGNYNIIIRNESSYNLLNDFLNVLAKIFLKYNIISNSKICYLDKEMRNRRDDFEEKIAGLDDSIIVFNDRKMRIDYEESFDTIKRIIKNYSNRIFIFEDTGMQIGGPDSIIGDFASWRMTIEKISLDDKIKYCKKEFDSQNIKYSDKDIKEFADIPFWILKNVTMQLIVKCKVENIDFIDNDILNKTKNNFNGFSDLKKDKNTSQKDKELLNKDSENINNLIGLQDVKDQINKVINYIKINKKRGKMPTLHMCFTGNPGTGKTSVARAVGEIFKKEKILSEDGEFVEIHGRDLVGKYVGWTAQNVHKIVEKAMGGVLFIDEAYSLVADRRGSFEDEAIATLIKEMEDHRNELCVILAGYTDEMEKLIKLNPGFESRIQFKINFPNYNENELLEIFMKYCKEDNYKLSRGCKDILLNNFIKVKNTDNFSNGRYIRNLFEKVRFEQANRIVNNTEYSLNMICISDIKNAIKETKLNASKERRAIGFAV